MQVFEKDESDESVSPDFYRCPAPCGFQKKPLSDFCQSCPVNNLQKEWEQATIGYLKKRVGDRWEKFGLDHLVSVVYQIAGIEIDASTTRAVARLIRIFKGEEALRRRTERYNRNQETKNPRK